MVENKDQVPPKRKDQLSIQEYQTLKAKEDTAAKKRPKMPKAVSFLMYLPLILIGVFGLIWIPYMAIMMFSKPAPVEKAKTVQQR